MTALLPPLALGHRLRLFRRHRGLTVREVAAAVGCSAKAVYDWEEGKSCPPLEMALLLAEVYGTTCEELCGEGGVVSNPPVQVPDVVPEFHCLKCAHRWLPLVLHPKRCPRCNSRLWNTEQRRYRRLGKWEKSG